MGMLDVWVARSGAACLVDDRHWRVRIEDGHGHVYTWAGNSYGDLHAPQAHWAGTIPPGTYVVRARLYGAKKREAEEADAAIVEVGCDGVSCVRLHVARPRGRDEWPPDESPPDESPPDDRHEEPRRPPGRRERRPRS